MFSVQVHRLCQDNPCKNKAKCKVKINGETGFYCDCPLGFQGKTCEERIDVEVPHFGGASYLQYYLPDKESLRHSTAIQMEIFPDYAEGMILWLGVDPTVDDYLGGGLEAGLVKIVWNLGWFSRTELVIPDRNVTDTAWHSINISRSVSLNSLEKFLVIIFNSEQVWLEMTPFFGTFFKLTANILVNYRVLLI